MESKVQIHLMVPIAGRPTLRGLFADQHEVSVPVLLICMQTVLEIRGTRQL
jgi:hypothetical protein